MIGLVSTIVFAMLYARVQVVINVWWFVTMFWEDDNLTDVIWSEYISGLTPRNMTCKNLLSGSTSSSVSLRERDLILSVVSFSWSMKRWLIASSGSTQTSLYVFVFDVRLDSSQFDRDKWTESLSDWAGHWTYCSVYGPLVFSSARSPDLLLDQITRTTVSITFRPSIFTSACDGSYLYFFVRDCREITEERRSSCSLKGWYDQ